MGLNVAELAVESLIANGIDTLYCVPGVQNDPFFNALYDYTDRLEPVQARHEQGAAYMALGAALATGRSSLVRRAHIRLTLVSCAHAFCRRWIRLSARSRRPSRSRADLASLPGSCPCLCIRVVISSVGTEPNALAAVEIKALRPPPSRVRQLSPRCESLPQAHRCTAARWR